MNNLNSSRNIILIGPMGAGKTTIGRQIAQSLNYNFFDSDREIEERTGASIPLIFELEGEAGFRKREQDMIAELVKKKRIVLATGGGVVLNEKAVKAMGITDPIGKRLVDRGRNPEDTRYMPIIGVVKDFHFESMHSAIRPMAIFPIRFNGRLTAARISAQNINSTLNFIEETWEDFAFDQAFEYVFMDDEFKRIYAAERVTANLFTAFSMLAWFHWAQGQGLQ